MFSYRSILKRSTLITWKNRYLWFFGLFAAFLSLGAEYRILPRILTPKESSAWYFNLRALLDSGFLSGQFFQNLAINFKNNPGTFWSFIIFSIIILGIIILVLWLAIAAQIALVKSTQKIMASKGGIVGGSLRDGLSVVGGNFWSVLGLDALIKIMVSIIVMIVGIPMMFPLVNKFSVSVAYTLLVVIFVPVAIILSLIIKYAVAYVVLKEKTFRHSIVSGWHLFKTNWIISIEMAIILFVVPFIASLLIILGSFIIAVPFIFIGAACFQLFTTGFILWAVIFLGALAVLAFIILSGSMLSAFQIIAWTDLFLTLNNEGGVSKLERIFKR